MFLRLVCKAVWANIYSDDKLIVKLKIDLNSVTHSLSLDSHHQNEAESQLIYSEFDFMIKPFMSINGPFVYAVGTEEGEKGRGN